VDALEHLTEWLGLFRTRLDTPERRQQALVLQTTPRPSVDGNQRLCRPQGGKSLRPGAGAVVAAIRRHPRVWLATSAKVAVWWLQQQPI
jgi:hypothetical protein